MNYRRGYISSYVELGVRLRVVGVLIYLILSCKWKGFQVIFLSISGCIHLLQDENIDSFSEQVFCEIDLVE